MELAAEYPDLVTLLDLGKSYEGRSIIAVKVTNIITGGRAGEDTLL